MEMFGGLHNGYMSKCQKQTRTAWVAGGETEIKNPHLNGGQLEQRSSAQIFMGQLSGTTHNII